MKVNALHSVTPASQRKPCASLCPKHVPNCRAGCLLVLYLAQKKRVVSASVGDLSFRSERFTYVYVIFVRTSGCLTTAVQGPKKHEEKDMDPEYCQSCQKLKPIPSGDG